jgi:hypothetical protein
MRDVTFKDLAMIAKRRGHTPESLAALFRGKIEDAREFFERALLRRWRGEDRSDVVIPYRSVIGWYHREVHYFADSNPKQRTCACGCGLPVFDRTKWASSGCRKRIQRQKATDSNFAYL